MLKDLSDDLLIFYETDDAHPALALGADKGINLVDFPNHHGPILPRALRPLIQPENSGDEVIFILPLAPASRNVSVVAVIPHHLFTLARDMRTHGRQPLQGVKSLLFFVAL